MSQACFWGHRSSGVRYPCLDGQTVCARCCVEHCRSANPADFARCTRLGHPTWPHDDTLLPRKLVCLEGDWNNDELFDRTTVQPFLDCLAQLGGPLGSLAVAHRHVEGVESLLRLTTSTLWKDSAVWDCPVYYLAFHGRKGRLSFAHNEAGVGVLRKAFDGFGAYPHLLYFGACSTLGGESGRRLAASLLEHAGSRAIVGYTREVDWLDSMVVDLIFLRRFYADPAPWKNMRRLYEDFLRAMPLAVELGFTLFLPEGE